METVEETVEEIHSQIDCFLEEYPQYTGAILDGDFSADQRVYSLLNALKAEFGQVKMSRCQHVADVQKLITNMQAYRLVTIIYESSEAIPYQVWYWAS